MHKSATIALIIHIFYENGWDVISPQLKQLDQFELKVLVNICDENLKREQLSIGIKETYPDAVLIFSPNVGKDIGGKLALLDLAIQLKIHADYYILLHDKKSPHTTIGDRWREKLFKILEKESAAHIHALFMNNKKIGMVVTKEMVTNEYDSKTGDFTGNNNEILKKLIPRFNFKLLNYDFAGGTMFWVRAEIFNRFFEKHPALEIRATLEKGNVLDHTQGTATHAWERMLSFIVANENYELMGI